jgi:hypothetical protein
MGRWCPGGAVQQRGGHPRRLLARPLPGEAQLARRQHDVGRQPVQLVAEERLVGPAPGGRRAGCQARAPSALVEALQAWLRGQLNPEPLLPPPSAHSPSSADVRPFRGGRGKGVASAWLVRSNGWIPHRLVVGAPVCVSLGSWPSRLPSPGWFTVPRPTQPQWWRLGVGRRRMAGRSGMNLWWWTAPPPSS